MNKGDLINNVAQAAGITKAQASEAVNAVFNSIEGTVKKGDKATLIGFGTFSVSKRSARTGRNPPTGAAIQNPARKVARFKPGSKLADAVK